MAQQEFLEQIVDVAGQDGCEQPEQFKDVSGSQIYPRARYVPSDNLCVAMVGASRASSAVFLHMFSRGTHHLGLPR